MDIYKLSASSYKTYSSCEMKFFIDQCLGYRFPSMWKSTDKGSILHSVMECLGRVKKALQDDQPYYEHKILGPISTNLDALDIDYITNYIYFNFIGKYPQHDWNKADLEEIHKWTHTILDYRDGIFNPLKRHIVDIEKGFGIQIEKDWAKLAEKYLKLTGFIDLVVSIDGDENGIEIIDWKSSKHIKDFNTGEQITYSFLLQDIQLLIYHYACKKLYGEDKNILTTIYYFNNKIGPQTLHLEDNMVGGLEDKIQARFEEIRANNFPQQNRTYKCRKFCDFGMKTLADVGRIPLEQFLSDGIAKKGKPCTICDEVHISLTNKGLDKTIEEYKK